MAQMIPEAIPTKASQGEQLIFNTLRDKLPDDFLVWYEPRVKTFYPDFLILGPSFGVLILEVKGWYAGQIEKADSHYFQVRWQRHGQIKTESYPSPLRQGHGYFAQVADVLMGYPILCQPEGNYQGKLAFPIGVGAVMSNMTEAQAREENLYGLLEKPEVAYRDEVLEWGNCLPEVLIQRLRDMFKVTFDFPRLSADQINTLKGCLHPETAIKEIPATQMSLPLYPGDDTPELPDNATVLLSLDVEQERLTRRMKDGHRIFSGVAGSGKTLILLSRAKALANRMQAHRILVLCFNVTLSAYLRSTLHSDERNPQYRERIEVRHFHDWARSLLGSLPSHREFADEEEYNEFLGQQVIQRLAALPTADHYDSVLVDEGHTFSRSWFMGCVAALKDPVNGDLLIVNDGSQSLYQRRKFTWKSVGVQALGRSKRLSQNYRNTQEILSAAWSVVQGTGDDGDEVTFPAVEPSAALRHGPKPTLHQASSRAEAVEAVLAQVRSLCESGYSPADLAILYRRKEQRDATAFDTLLKRLDDMGLRPYWVTQDMQTKTQYSATAPGIRIITALSSLGLEFKVVLLLWVEQFADCCNEDEDIAAIARRQLYVAMTRAQDELHLFAGKYARLVGELKARGEVDTQTVQDLTPAQVTRNE
jgi:hypothetical protein